MNELFRMMNSPRSFTNKSLVRHRRAVVKMIRHCTRIYSPTPHKTGGTSKKKFPPGVLAWFRSSFSIEMNLRYFACITRLIMMIEMNGNNRQWEIWHFDRCPVDKHLFRPTRSSLRPIISVQSRRQEPTNERPNERRKQNTRSIEMRRTGRITSKTVLFSLWFSLYCHRMSIEAKVGTTRLFMVRVIFILIPNNLFPVCCFSLISIFIST